MSRGREGESTDQGVVLDDKAQEQRADKERARKVSRTDKGNDPPGQKKQE